MTNICRVLITGTSQGIGKKLLEKYVHMGMQVIAVDRQPTLLSVTEAYPTVLFRQADIADESAVEELIASLVVEELLPDICIFNAAVHEIDNEPFIDYAILRKVIGIDMLSTLKFLSLLMPQLNRPATFVFCSSGVVIFPNPAYLGYFLSKLALTKVFEIFSDRYASCGFRFKSVILGPIKTDMLQQSRNPTGLVRFLRALITGTPEMAAERIVAFVTGPRQHLHYRFSAAAILWGARFVQSMFPSFLKVYQVSPPSKTD